MNPYDARFVNLVENLCRSAAVITVLVSLLFLYKDNKAFDEEDGELFGRIDLDGTK